MNIWAKAWSSAASQKLQNEKNQIDFNPSEYGITISKRNMDGHRYFTGTVSELPDVEVFEDTLDDAYKGILGIIGSLKLLSMGKQRSFPNPKIPTDENRIKKLR
jgi:hypothetical protein